jgi:hypothetical protein
MMAGPFLHLWLKFQRNIKQTYNCPGFPLSYVSSRYMQGCQVNYQYLIPLSNNLFTHKNNIVRGFVFLDNNIFVMEERQVFSNIWVFKD